MKSEVTKSHGALVPTPCYFVTSLFTSVDYKTVTFSVFCLSLVFLLMRKTRKYLGKEMSKRGLKFIIFVQKLCLILENRFLVRLSSNFQERLLILSSMPQFIFGVSIFSLIRA